MKKLVLKFVVFSIIIMSLSCSKDDEVQRNNESIIPTSFLNRENKVLGSIEVESRDIKISVWDHGQIDGDIVSIYVNGKVVIAEKLLDGPSNKFVAQTTLEYSGYNYVLLYAHNEGRISPNTASMSIEDGKNTRKFVLRSNLETNGAVDLIVN